MKSLFCRVLIFSFLLTFICCVCLAQQNSDIIPGERIGEFMLGLSKKDTNKLIGQTSQTQTFPVFKENKAIQIASTNTNYVYQNKIFVGGSLGDYISLFPESQKSFIPGQGDFLYAYYYDVKSGIGITFMIGPGGENAGNFSLKDIGSSLFHVGRPKFNRPAIR